MDNKNIHIMQEPTLAEPSTKIFTDVREDVITRAIANEFHED